MQRPLIFVPGDNGPFGTQWRRLRVTPRPLFRDDQWRGLAPLAGKDKVG